MNMNHRLYSAKISGNDLLRIMKNNYFYKTSYFFVQSSLYYKTYSNYSKYGKLFLSNVEKLNKRCKQLTLAKATPKKTKEEP